MEFQNVPEETRTGRSNEPLEQLEKALDRGTSKRVAECGTFSSYGVDAIGDMIEKVADLKIHGIPEFQVSFTDSPFHEFSSSINAFSHKGNGKVYEQTNSNSPFEISPGPDIPTRNIEEFQNYSKNRGFRPSSYSDRDVFSFPRRRNGRDLNDLYYEETKSKPGDIFNQRSQPVSPRQSHFQEQRRPAFVKTTKNRNVMEGRDERSYRKEKLHKTSSSSSTFSSKRNHMPVTRSKSYGGKPNDPFRVSYGSMDYQASQAGGVTTSLRRRALSNATSLSLATKNPVSYQEPTNALNQENRHRWRKPREDNRTQHQNPSRYGTHGRKSLHSLDFMGLLPVMDIPGIDTGEVTFCPPNGCKHIRITNCPWGSQNGETKTLEFINPITEEVDLDGGFLKTNISRTNSFPDHSKYEADDKFFEKFRDLESYWNRRHSSPLLRSQWSPTSPQPSIWQPSNEVNLSPFSLLPSHSAPCTPCHTPVSLKGPCLSDLANKERTSPAIDVSHGSVFFQKEEIFKKLEDIQQHHPALKRNMSEPPGCSTWHPLHSSLKSPLSQDIESGKRFSYDGK